MSTFHKGMVVYVVLAIVFMAIAYNAGYAKGKSGEGMGSASVADVGSGVNVLKGESSGYVGTWAMADNGRILIINADGTAMTPEMGNWSENRFKWHSEGNRIVFDGWVINKGFGFGFGFGEVDGNQIRLCDEAGITGHEQTWFRSRN